MATRVAIQGYKGCFHEQAARLFYSSPAGHPERGEESLSIVECDSFEQLYEALDEGRADAAVMAIENTVSGGLLHNFELLRLKRRRVKGEVYIRIGQNLMALPGQTLEDIREVRTHYMAINQTRPWFEKNAPWIRSTESDDTAKSAAQLARTGEKGVGAVASALAAQLYGLEILAPDIETHKQNFTRFLILDERLRPDGPDKALLPGATTVGRATDGIFPPDDGVDGEIMRELAAATPTALRTPGGFSETARKTLQSLRKGGTAAAAQAASEIENLLADADLLERCRLALLET